ncbi:MAG: general secretion pathway protein GspM [Mesorhizobium sp.]|uniref:type II secretion system protein GspM n=1 Tax=Mesorhizobium sp. TaxID=1871066 RepID=UPI000FE506EC|nr:type II secretion system protein GspM [Mesorhizobium sp.]RWD47028.1 MAG: general secretion pathway protein GspM [Mesorhizobium sp.]RWE52186.1 MAG: general secretion pathway protein GspM [Mesorhizobium sp.]RWF11052.1 MAG: general secretion pathway protein GspM [Mesorhizobium sp.]RWF20876.1 MAG: general secretion pathway protein GspM [Mesorhizobium sp.]
MLSTILNARPMVRRLIAAAIAAATACVAGWVVFTAFDSVAAAEAGIQEKREMLGQLQAVAALAKRLDSASDPAAATNTEFLTGESDAVIRGGLQTRLNAVAASNGVSVLSAGNAPALNEAGVDFIGLRANISGPLEGVHSTILAIETSLPVLFIREATLRTTNVGPAARQTADSELFAEILFYGPLQTKATSASSETKP